MNKHIKSIVKTSKGIQPTGNPHKFKLKRGSVTVGENGDVITSTAFRYPITRNRMCVYSISPYFRFSSLFSSLALLFLIRVSQISPSSEPYFPRPLALTEIHHNVMHVNVCLLTLLFANNRGLHHFAVKSKEEYREKTLRGSGMSHHKTDKFWNEVENDTPHVECKEMVHYEP